MEIPSSQILMLIQQFLQENNLTESLTTLQQESKVYYKSTTFLNHFTTGNYLECLRDISTCSINPRILVDLYENIVMDWIEEGQVAGARMLLTQTEPMILLRESDSVRYLELEGRLTRIPTKSTELERSIKR